MSNLFNRIIKVSIYLLVFLLPLFWLPFSLEAFEFNKQYLLFFLVSIAFLAWLAKMILADKEIRLRRSPFDLFVLAFLFTAILSAIFSADRHSSIFGFYGRFSDGLINLLSLVALYFIITNNAGLRNEKLKTKSEKPQLKTKNEAGKTLESPLLSVDGILKALMWSVFLIVLISYLSVFGILAKFSNLQFSSASWRIPFQFSLPAIMQQSVFNPAAGSLEGLSVFLAVIIALIVGLLLSDKRKSLASNIFYFLLLITALGLLVIIDFTPAWIVILISSALLVGLALRKRIFREDVNKLLLPILLIIFVIPFFFIETSNFKLAIPSKGAETPYQVGVFQLPEEQVLAQGQSWKISLKAVVENLKSGFLGSGIGTFSYDFSKFKSKEFNQSPFWQIRFDRPGNHFAEVLGTMGFLGMLSYLLLAGFFLLINHFLCLKAGFKQRLPLLMAFLALLVGQFVYYQNTVLTFAFWLILGLSVVGWQPTKTEEEQDSGRPKLVSEAAVSFKNFPELSLIFSTLIIILGLSFLGIYFFAVRFYLADVNYKNAIAGTAIIQNLEKAVRFNPYRSDYKIVLSRVYLNEVLAETQKPVEDRDQVALSNNVYRAINYAKGGPIGSVSIKGAVELSPNRVAAWETLGMIYRDIQGIAAGSSEWAIKSFEKAITLEPTNPILHGELGKLYLASNDLEGAKTEFKRAKELRADYLDAAIQLALIYERENNLKEAIGEMESIAASYPLNTEVLFQLGRLYFNNNRLDEAILQFEKIVNLVPNHSNALYSLGVAYQKKGEKVKAVAAFGKVLQLNPGNQDVLQRLEELKK